MEVPPYRRIPLPTQKGQGAFRRLGARIWLGIGPTLTFGLTVQERGSGYKGEGPQLFHGCGPVVCYFTWVSGRRDSHVHVLKRRDIRSRVRGAPSKHKDVRANSDQATYKPKETQGGTE